mmetsp:Transcript_73159/g.223794  ORF Transcript_73159/g.223794 Transcript_73159/m.223794 type:complete len:279 (-) Transcript_73159:325-1161(-)
MSAAPHSADAKTLRARSIGTLVAASCASALIAAGKRMCSKFLPEQSLPGSAFASSSSPAAWNRPCWQKLITGEGSTSVGAASTRQPLATNLETISARECVPPKRLNLGDCARSSKGVRGLGRGAFDSLAACSSAGCSAAFGSAPRSSSSSAKSLLPARHAHINGVRPWASRASTDAFPSMSARAMLTATWGASRRTSSKLSPCNTTFDTWTCTSFPLSLTTTTPSLRARMAIPSWEGNLPSAPLMSAETSTGTAGQVDSSRPKVSAALRCFASRALHN